MTAIRQDAWSDEDDLILAEVTLRHIREGSTQLSAFEEVGEKIGRTAAACGFRWNSFVRKKYEAAIQIAKAQRQKRNQQRKHANAFASVSGGVGVITDSSSVRTDGIVEELSIDAVIRFLRQWKGSYQEMVRHLRQLEKELNDKQDELERLRSENEELNKQVSDVSTDYRVVNDDYKALIQIMDRARKLAFLVEEDEETKARFKMDENGNLERIE
ncbi:RsfA family transcriptional regulator [Paenibacillus validus]|uniref:RsfA family transcriptional regulator n=1 Tax=Paenibacillus validus TaxID=44253 RepID=A0A7X2ZE51_9BACL|nr:RsfA family transcriptional regulator [Paenibacillus validus]MED4601125.1 RsfA family transcriptional regulator [Paenibacillus validus]MED4608199.1 RsfA family transcriptional regulator [Paenibacillus validus]MUG72578.1 RsfA family transcriptional regulator [Paenibacillus validus]